MHLLNIKVDDVDCSDYIIKNINFENMPGFFTIHNNKLVCYIDLLGISNFYEKLKHKNLQIVEQGVVDKLFNQLFKVLYDIDEDIYSVHVVSDTVLIVPKTEPLKHKDVPTVYEFFRMVFNSYEQLLTNDNPCKVIITRGQYFSVGVKEQYLNILPGGEAFLKCNTADKFELKGKGPGIFTDIIEYKRKSSKKWDLIDIDIFNQCVNDKSKLKKNIKRTRDNHIKEQNHIFKRVYNDLVDWVGK